MNWLELRLRLAFGALPSLIVVTLLLQLKIARYLLQRKKTLSVSRLYHLRTIFLQRETLSPNSVYKIRWHVAWEDDACWFFLTKRLSYFSCRQRASLLVVKTLKMSDVGNLLLMNMLCLNLIFLFLFLSFFVGKSIVISVEYVCFNVAMACLLHL